MLVLAVALYLASREDVLLCGSLPGDCARSCLARISLTLPTCDGRLLLACEFFAGNVALVRAKSSAVTAVVEVGRCSL
jgi:hypothetical protein